MNTLKKHEYGVFIISICFLQEIDAVVFATGYEYKIGIVDESVTRIQDNKTTLYKYMFPPHLSHPSLAIVGLVQAVGAVMPISEMQCRWFSNIMKGRGDNFCYTLYV